LKHIEYWNIHYIKKPIFKTALRSKARSFASRQRQSPRQGDSPAVGFLIGIFRRGNKPSVLPGEEKRAEQQKEGEPYASLMQARLMLKP